MFDVDAAAAVRTVAAITSDGGKAAAFACDITNHEGVQSAVSEVNASLGPIDVFMNNAGWDIFKPFLEQRRRLIGRS